MATKSVIEIDILDEKFQAFQKAFEKYQQALKAMPADWNKVNSSIVNIDKKQKDFNKSLRDGNSLLKEAANSTGMIARNLASSVVSIGKWLAVSATVGGFGLGGLASSASDYRRTAQGLGVTTGQLRGANVTLGRYINPEATLGNIADIQADLSRRQILGRLGAGQGQNPAEALPNIIRNAVQQFKQGGQTQQYAEAMGLTQVFSMQELRRLASLNAKELEDTIKDFERARKSLDVTDESNRQWQNFWYQLKESGQQLETSFIKNLTILTPQLQALSKTVVDAIDSFMSSEKVKVALEEFNEYLKSPEFKQDIETFFNAIKKLANAAFSAAQFLGLISAKNPIKGGMVDTSPSGVGGAVMQGLKNYGTLGQTATRKMLQKINTQRALDFLIAKGVNPEAAAGFVGGLIQESNLDPNAVNASGHAGIAQWDKDVRAKEFMNYTGKPLQGSSIQDQLRFMAYEFETKEKSAFAALMRAKTKEQGVAANLMYERPAPAGSLEYQYEMEKRLRIANTINVRVNNQTGGQAVTTVNALQGASQ